MQPIAAAPGKIRFGMFEVDISAGELRRRGHKVPLENQPFQLLVLLLRHPGEGVTREELQKALWPDGTFVEFEHGVNTAVNKIRQALGDSAHNPRFIETLPRKGYRFIAPVVGAETQSPPPVLIAPARRRSIWIVVFAALAVLAAR